MGNNSREILINGEAIDTVLFYDEDDNEIGETSDSVIITRKVINDHGDGQCGSLSGDDIDMIMSCLIKNDH